MNVYFDPTDHSYTSEYGKEYTPVTRICGITPRAINFKALPYQDRVKKAASRGTTIHLEQQNFIETGEVGVLPTTKWFIDNLFPKYRNWEAEVLIYSDEDDDKESFAGQIDAVAQDENDDYHLFDNKSGGHETVDYQESLYKRGFCKMRNIDPKKVHLHCIDMKNEDKIKVFDVRDIPKEWLDRLLHCYKNGKQYAEPSMELTGMPVASLQQLEALEAYYKALEAEVKQRKDELQTLKDELYKAMEEAKVNKFTYNSLSVTKVGPTTADTFDAESFAKDHPELYKAYIVTSSRAGYVKLKVKDLTEAK